MVGVSAFVNLPLHHKVQKFSSGSGSPGWSRKRGRKNGYVVVVVFGSNCEFRVIFVGMVSSAADRVLSMSAQSRIV